MKRREGLYFVLAILGLVVTWWFNVLFMIRGGSWVDLPAVMSLAFANPIASSFSADLLVAFAAFIVWSVAEARRIGMRNGWLYPLLGLFIAFAFAFPLFLFMRERRLRAEDGTR